MRIRNKNVRIIESDDELRSLPLCPQSINILFFVSHFPKNLCVSVAISVTSMIVPTRNLSRNYGPYPRSPHPLHYLKEGLTCVDLMLLSTRRLISFDVTGKISHEVVRKIRRSFAIQHQLFMIESYLSIRITISVKNVIASLPTYDLPFSLSRATDIHCF